MTAAIAAAALGAEELLLSDDSGEGGCRSVLLPVVSAAVELIMLLFALLLGLLPPRSVPITPMAASENYCLIRTGE